jgi:hypothetical protein
LKKLDTVGKYVVEMFEQLDGVERKNLGMYCCNGSFCHGDDPSRKVSFQFVPGAPIKDKVVIWLKLGIDEAYVMNPEPPSIDKRHWRVVEKLG